ncbi:MAG: type II toxin-antitoxin system RelE/ParE family toxin [Prevotellaceae bacterium]|jgi:phage-related protein|nr:type II toxin-antitoxin system RelE/ParE family toxin [Prevotellaceae bacterium]
MDKNRVYIRQIVVYGDYFKAFKKTLSREVLRKIYQIFMYIMTQEHIPAKYFSSIVGVQGLFEIRVEERGNIYRIFCCMDEENLVVLFNGFQKKSQKTPVEEIARATRIMKAYFQQKNKEN